MTDPTTLTAAAPLERAGVMREPFEAFYAARLAGAVRLARVLVDRREDAEEVAQEAFARLYHRYEHLESPEAYLRACVLNRARLVLRRRGLAAAREPLAAGPGDPTSPDHLLDAVRRLPKARRDVVVLRYYLGLSEAEIAHTLSIRPGTVKSRLHRALAQLREALA